MTYSAIDLFAGPGGWDLAAKKLGLDVLGIEFDHAACETRRAAGLPTVEGDVRDFSPLDWRGVEGFIASPPCQTFSMAGKGAGRKALDVVLGGIQSLVHGEPLPDFEDERTGLVLEPLRWVLHAWADGIAYRWIAFEQVPAVLPVWEAMAEVFSRLGYSVATGILNAEQYGVPQTRRRAVLIGSLDREVSLPKPTHSRYYSRDPKRLDEGVAPWVSMAEALDRGMTERPAMTVTGGIRHGRPGAVRQWGARLDASRIEGGALAVMRSNYGTGGDPSKRGERTEDEPSATVTSKADRNVWFVQNARANATRRSYGEPSPTITGA